MVAGKFKSRTFRRVKITTPGGENKISYRHRKPATPKCGSCGAVLKGVPRARKSEIVNMPKTAKRPERPYGGVLCSKCMRAKIKDQARQTKI